MKNLKQIKEEIKILGYYQLVGGIIGIGLAVFQLIELVLMNTYSVVTILTVILLALPFLLSIYAGNQCLKDKKNQLSISKINQVFQVIAFNVGGILGVTYHSGVYFAIGVDITDDFLLLSKFGFSHANFELNTSSETSFIWINLIALYLIYRIGIYESRIEDIEELMNEDEFE